MPQGTPASARICPNCDGFPSVQVTTGGRDQHDHLHTTTADCPACHGTGTARRPVRTREASRV